MTVIPTEVTIACGENRTVFSAQRIIIRVEDEAAGPFLSIQGIDDEPVEGNEHCFYLCTEADIDLFAATCKKLLADAERSMNNTKENNERV